MPADWLLVVVDLALVIAVARCGGWLAGRVGQPRIAGELVAVVAIGPTVLGGRVEGVVEGSEAAGAVGALFPPPAVEALTLVGGLGLMLYMLLVGLTVDPRALARRAAAISVLAVAVTGAAVAPAIGAALWLHGAGGWGAPGVGATAFALALAAALAAHGVPVAARIIEERGLLRSELGGVVIASGALATTVALIVAGVAVEGADAAAALRLVAILVVVAAAVAALAPLARSPRLRPPPRAGAALLLGGAVVAGVAGETLVGTALLGPLALGVLISSAGAPAGRIEARLGALVRGALLPVFLGVAALHTDLRELWSGALAPAAALIAAVIAAKLGAGYLAARAGGFSAPEARAVGALLQCGGIMTIAISLDVLDGGLISTRTHAALTLVGLVTTVLTGPLVGRAGARPRGAVAAAGT